MRDPKGAERIYRDDGVESILRKRRSYNVLSCVSAAIKNIPAYKKGDQV